MTLNKVRVDLKDNDRFFGVSYVALSRAKRLKDILIDLFDDSRFEPSLRQSQEKYDSCYKGGEKVINFRKGNINKTQAK